MNCLSNEENPYILKLLVEWLEFMYGDVIGISYIFNPVLLGKDILDEHKIRVDDSLFESETWGVVITNANREQYKTKKEQLGH